MGPVERDAPPDAKVRHQQALSLDGRALIPMWDSSDPERAPPPLPLNPQSPSVSPSRAGTSLAIQSAHAALTEKARETALVPSLARRMTDSPPEWALTTRSPSPHKRTQTLSTGNSVRDLSLMIEGARGGGSETPTPRGSPEKTTRPSTPARSQEPEREKDDADREPPALSSPTPTSANVTPTVRPSLRRPPQSILGENTPPQSATMLALQNMATPRDIESPLGNVTNNSSAMVRAPQSFDHISGQIFSLTSIATQLQKEMTALSRRSRDNATDLMSLKEATHARDEDIRKSLRELVTNIDNPRSKRDTQPSSGSFLDSARGCPSPSAKPNRPISLPRIPSPNSFAASFDRESGISTPSLVNSVNSESPATIALLEKIIREMGTKDGQDSVLGRLSDLAERLTGMASSGKVEELIQQLKTANHERSMIPASGGAGGGNGGGNRPRKFSFEEGDDDDEHDRGLTDFDWSQRNGHGQQLERFVGDLGSRRSSAPTTRGAEVLSNDVINIIQSVKDSVSQGGGMTAEVKALVRELRGEVLGMGRDIARKLDEVDSNAAAMNDPASKDELARVVEEGLDQMKQQMDQVLREHRRSSSASTKSAVDYQEIYNAMRTALNDTDIGNKGEPDLSRDDVMLAVKEAWENYKPDITVEQIGLERDEVLACLQEGLQEYTPKQDEPAITKEEVYRAVVEGLKHFVPPQVESPAALSRDEILEAVRECLEEFEFPIAPSAIGNDVSREDMVDAVQEGLKSFDFPQAQHNESAASHGADNSEVIDRLHDIMQFMQDEFKSVSEEAKQNVAANGRDTEQVLDATKDGFDQLRNHMEGYVDRVSGGAGQEELMHNMLASFDNFRDEISELVAKASDGSKSMLKEEVESLRDTVNSSLVPHVPQAPDNREALDAIREGVERVRQELLRPHAGTTDILDALHEGFSDLKTVVERIGDKPSDLTANDEILDAIDTGLKGVRTDIGSLRETNNEQAVANIGASSQDAVVPTDMLKHEDIKNLEVMMTQLRIKVEAMEGSQPASDVSGGGLSKEDLGEVEDMIRGVQDSVSAISNAEVEESIRNVQASIEAMSNVELEEAMKNLQESVSALTAAKDPEAVNPEDASTKEDVQAIETILRNTKARLEEIIDDEQAVKKDHLDAVEKLVLETKESVGSVSGQLEELSRKEDLVSIESLATQINASLDEMKERAEKALEDPEKVTKTDVDAIEAAVMDIKNVVDQINNKPDAADLPSKDDLKALEDILKEVKESGVTHAEANAKHFEERQAETVGVGERVTEVKTFLEEFQGTVKDKLESGAEGVENVRQLLESLKDGMGDNSGVSDELKEILDTLKTEFEESKAGVVGSKLDTDEKLQSATDTLGGKIDDKIGELISKYDEFQTVMEERTKAGEARDVEMEAAVVSTKAITDELKVLIDTLGSSVTDSLEKMEEASQTVFSQVEQMYTKSDENHTDIKDEHQTTRDQIKEAVALVEGLQGQVSETQPQILDAVKEVLLIVGQHYEHSKSSVSDLHQKLEDAKPESDESRMLPAPADKFDDSEIHSKLDSIVGSKYDDSTVQSKLDKIVEEKYDDSEVLSRLDKLIEEKYSDDEVHSKLDKLMEGKTDEEIHSKLDKLLEGASTDEEVHAKLDKLVEEKYDDTEVLARLEKLMEDKYDDGEVKEKLDKLIEEKYDDIEVIARLEKLLEDKYDDTEVLARLEKITEDKYDDADLQAKVDKLSEEKYDDAELKAKIDELLEAKFDDTELKAKIDQLLEEKYDDAELKAKIDQVLEEKYDDAEVRARLDKLVEERYDDTEVRAQLATISEQKYDDAEVITRLDKIIEEKYDDAEIRSRLDKLSEEKYDDTEVRAQLSKLGEEKYDDTEVRNQLAKIIEERYDDSELQVRIGDLAEQLDPSNMHSKLDQLLNHHETGEVQQKLSKLVDHTEAADKAYAQLETLDKVHSQVVQTAAEISEFLTAQRQRITDEHEDREKTLQETNVSLERQRAEQQQVEANVAQLRDEEAELRQSVAALRAEQESLNRQKIRMTADVSSLETALHIRREELHEMDMRAEGLERRILEGVLDHSRSLLMNKPKPKGREAMSRKRVPGARTSLTPAEVAEPISKPSPRPKAVNMAMASNRTSMVPGSQSPANRRILSLSQITNNTPTGGLARSKSVRTPAAGGLRKSSWAPGRIGAGKAYGDLDKENDLVKEADEPLPPLSSRGPSPEPDDIDLGSEPEPEPEPPVLDDETATEMGPEDHSEDEGAMTAVSGDEGDDHRDALSETGTLRRSSQGTTVVTGGAGTDAEDGDGDEDSYYSGDDYDSRSEYTDSAVGTESVVTGAESYVTESVGDDAESLAGDGEVVLHTG